MVPEQKVNARFMFVSIKYIKRTHNGEIVCICLSACFTSEAIEWTSNKFYMGS